MRHAALGLAILAIGSAACGGPGRAPTGSGGSLAGSSGSGSGGLNASSGGSSSTSGAGGVTAQASGAAGMDAGGAAQAGAPSEPSQGQLSDCALAFPYQEQAPRGHWLGGDSNFSVVLSKTRALMTFQDTFVGGTSSASRAATPMVGNTLALIGCEDGAYSIDYHWGGSAQDHRPMFDDQNPEGQRLWLQRPWLYAGKLLLTATRVSSDAQGFAEHGMTLIRVDNPLDAPESWSIEYFNLTDQRLTVGKGIADTEEHVYLFTPYAADMILTRIAKDRLLEPSISEASLEYLKGDGSWAPGLSPLDAKKLGLPANTGLTLRFHAASQRWLALFTNTSGWPSASIGVSSAPALEGPWSKPTQIYAVPEMAAQAPEYDPDTICYGASEHEAFNADPDGKIVFTYTCNSNQFEKLLANMAIYVPRVVTVDNPVTP